MFRFRQDRNYCAPPFFLCFLSFGVGGGCILMVEMACVLVARTSRARRRAPQRTRARRRRHSGGAQVCLGGTGRTAARHEAGGELGGGMVGAGPACRARRRRRRRRRLATGVGEGGNVRGATSAASARRLAPTAHAHLTIQPAATRSDYTAYIDSTENSESATGRVQTQQHVVSMTRCTRHRPWTAPRAKCEAQVLTALAHRRARPRSRRPTGRPHTASHGCQNGVLQTPSPHQTLVGCTRSCARASLTFERVGRWHGASGVSASAPARSA